VRLETIERRNDATSDLPVEAPQIFSARGSKLIAQGASSVTPSRTGA
jgi:hypothetical protein